jgi:hypothetical protein
MWAVVRVSVTTPVTMQLLPTARSRETKPAGAAPESTAGVDPLGGNGGTELNSGHLGPNLSTDPG